MRLPSLLLIESPLCGKVVLGPLSRDENLDISESERRIIAAIQSAVELNGGLIELPLQVVVRWLRFEESRAASKEALDLLRSLLQKRYIVAELGWDTAYDVGLQIRPEIIDALQRKTRERGNRMNRNSVFVVHGHDIELRESVARFVERLGFNAIILAERPSAGRTLIEQVERYSDAQYAIVLLTPDDITAQHDDAPLSRGRARQNVVFELGFFVGRLGRSRVHCLRKGDVELFSDFDGVVGTHVDEPGTDWRVRLAREMSEVGLDVDLNRVFGP